MTEWLLIAILVVNLEGKPIPRATVVCEGEFDTGFYEVRETDSRGLFVSTLQPGPHRCVVSKYQVSKVFTVDGEDIVVLLEVER